MVEAASRQTVDWSLRTDWNLLQSGICCRLEIGPRREAVICLVDWKLNNEDRLECVWQPGSWLKEKFRCR